MMHTYYKILNVIGTLWLVSIAATADAQPERVTTHDLTLVMPDGSINTDRVALYRNDEIVDRARVRLQMGDEYTSDFEIGYGRWQDGDWVSTFSLNGSGNGYFQNSLIIGTPNLPAGYRLAVNGKVRAKEIVVDTGWSDFVFEDGYKLRSLQETETFIKEHKHLPDIPSEKEVLENGIGLGEINSRLLQKIEELTLYMIEMEKKVEALEKKYKSKED